MGFDRGCLVEKNVQVIENLICPVCHDLIERAACCPRGHAFCSKCISLALLHSPKCPVDQGPLCAADLRPCKNLDNVIAELTVKCADCGSWTGTLAALPGHVASSCPEATVTCDVIGCHRRMPRKDIATHAALNTQRHFDLMSAVTGRVLERMGRRIAAVEGRHARESIYVHALAAVRDLFERPLDGFDLGLLPLGKTIEWEIVPVERAEFSHSAYVPSISKFSIADAPPSQDKFPVQMFASIPGPAKSEWEGIVIPLLIQFQASLMKPPIFRVPPGFVHPNIYPSGTVSLSTLNEDVGWNPLLTLRELLLNIKSLLSRPNLKCPSQGYAYDLYVNNHDLYLECVRAQVGDFTRDHYESICQEFLSFKSASTSSMKRMLESNFCSVVRKDKRPRVIIHMQGEGN